jgi:Na+/melibiose symporter-like transporter
MNPAESVPVATQPTTTTRSALVPISQKVAWGLGGLAENLANGTLLTLAYPIFQVALGVDPFWIGVALAAPRIIDAFFDPFMGNLTDNTKSRWGRRRPWMLLGAVLMALFFGLTWQVPTSLGQSGMVVFLTVMAVAFFLAFSVYIIPYSGLGLELAVDYDDRTRLPTYRVFAAFFGGMLVQWLYALAVNPVFKNDRMPTEVLGMRWVGAAVALVILATTLPSVFFCRERYAAKPQESIGLVSAIKLTFTDRPFLMLVGSAFFVFLGLFFVGPLFTYIGLYHVCGGDKSAFGTIAGWAGTAGAVGQLVAMPLIAWVSKYVDKKTVLLTGLGIAVLGYASTWWLFTPAHPSWAVIPGFVSNFGLCACWVVNGSFVADICDFDELHSGRRREGMFSAVFSFVYKCAIGLVALVSGAVLVWAGCDAKTGSVAAEALGRVRGSYAIIPAVALILAVVSMAFYPLSRARMREIQATLTERRGQTELA